MHAMTTSPTDTAARPAPRLRRRPTVRELPADLLTPVGAFLRLTGRGPSFLLESVERGQQVGRFSLLGAGCRPILLDAPPGRDLFEPLRAAIAANADVDLDDLPAFAGGAVGYVAYDAVRRFEPSVPLPERREGDPAAPARFLIADVVVVFDHVRRTVQVIAQPGHDREADSVAADLLGPLPGGVGPVSPLTGAGRSHAETTPEEYADAVRRVQRHIEAGDVFQTVISQRHVRPTAATPFAVYRALRAINPSPYMVYLDFGALQIVSASPETHVSLTPDGRATLKPIAGSRHRDADGAADDRLAEELRRDEKERAEHLMLVDLARNDLGRVCEPGSIEVVRALEVERYSHVMHLVSQVEGRLRADQDAFSLLEATFPAGTVSGAPKVRAMQLISEIEGHRRGIYAGALGYVGYDGGLDTCIALRTIVMRDGLALLQAGAGIVADSVPEREHEECLAKIAALSAAIDLAETGRYGR
jgi:anthranilate synthase component 1